jgi:hypothetical protein
MRIRRIFCQMCYFCSLRGSRDMTSQICSKNHLTKEKAQKSVFIFFIFVYRLKLWKKERYSTLKKNRQNLRMRPQGRIFWCLCHFCSPRGSRDIASQNRVRTFGTPCTFILVSCCAILYLSRVLTMATEYWVTSYNYLFDKKKVKLFFTVFFRVLLSRVLPLLHPHS